jgi:hypothetical protein
LNILEHAVDENSLFLDLIRQTNLPNQRALLLMHPTPGYVRILRKSLDATSMLVHKMGCACKHLQHQQISKNASDEVAFLVAF